MRQGQIPKNKQQLEWRRNKIDELSVKGFSQAEITKMKTLLLILMTLMTLMTLLGKV